MLAQKKTRQYALPLKLQPYRDEGPHGYLMRLAENNLLTLQELKAIGTIFDYDWMLNLGILVSDGIDPDLHRQISFISMLWQSETRIWNTQYARFCPHCLAESGYWKVEWELNFYDVCQQHQVWLVDQCSSCGNKISWNRNQLSRCSCGSILHAEQTKECPANMVEIASAIRHKILQLDSNQLPLVLQKTDVEQTQRLIRYLGNYMSLAAGKNPLKMRQAGDLNHSWPVTTLAAEVISDWPNAFHRALTQIEKQNRADGRPSLNEVFGQAYHYVFKALKAKPFDELRHQFELWINAAWKGGIAKRNKRLTSTLMKQASWVPATVACDYLGISHQRLDLLIREGTIEGETHISEKGRKFTMVRRDQLDAVKDQLFGLIDMTTAKNLLGLQKKRMRQLLTLLFKDAKKMGASPNAPWAISRQEVNKILELSDSVTVVSIPDEDCISLSHLLRYWTWSNQDVAHLIHAVKTGEMSIVNKLDNEQGIAAWNFKIQELKNWKLKFERGLSEWMTITQAAKVLGTKEQVAYELVKLGFLEAEVMPHQKKRGTRVKRSAIEDFNENYVFSTKVAEALNCSHRKVQASLTKLGINPISGPSVDGLRQVLYKRNDNINAIINGEVILDLNCSKF